MQNRITVRMTDEMIARIDAWLSRQSGYVSRQEAVRRLVTFSLEYADASLAPDRAAGDSVRTDTARPGSGGADS